MISSILRRPITVLVAVAAILCGSYLAIKKMPRDIFPPLGVPTIYVAQPYGGMDAAQMKSHLTYFYEYHFLYIANLKHVESKTIQGASIMKLEFHPGTDMSAAMAETISYVNRARAFMPAGAPNPFVTRFDAGSVPVGYLTFSTENPNRTLGQMQDEALNKVRPLFATLPGVSAPPPFGGSARAIVVNVDADKLRARGLSPGDVVETIAKSNVVSPSGNMILGDLYPIVPMNTVVGKPAELADVPIRSAAEDAVYVRDVATVTDGSDITTSFALVNGRRTVYLPVTKRSEASTLAVVDQVKRNIPKFQSAVAEDVKVSYEFDQSPVVWSSTNALVKEAALGVAAELRIGEVIYQNLAAKQRTKAAEHDVDAARNQTMAQVTQAYFRLLRAQASLQVSQQSRVLAGDYENQLSAAVKAGVAFEADELRAQVQTFRHDLMIRKTQEDVETASAKLCEMLRLPNGVNLRGDTGELTPLTYVSANDSMTSLVTTALNRRPELRSREAMLAAAKTDAEGTRKAPWYPDVTVRGFVGGFGGGFNSHTGNFDDTADGVIGIVWRVGPGGLFDSQLSATADSMADHESVLVEKTRQRITREVLESVAAVRSLRDRIAIAEKLLGAAEKAYALTCERGKQGIGGVPETLRSEEDLSFARLAYFDLVTESNIAQTKLRVAMGLSQ